MTKETGKEIYLEYVNRELNSPHEVIEEYFYYGKPISESDEFLNGLFVPCNFDGFTRALKTQMINGHEVIAPRYDMPQRDDMCFWLKYTNKEGFAQYDAQSLMPVEREALSINGWFDKKENVIAYANALRENK